MAADQDWRVAAAATVELLTDRIDEIRRLVDDRRYDLARRQAWGRVWLDRVELRGVPIDVIHRAQGWMEMAFEFLQEPLVDPGGAADALLRARRVITG